MKNELLAPAGNFEKLKLALMYGADAVYAGGKEFSLRAYADNFSLEEMEEAVGYVHERGKKLYVATNIFARNADFDRLGSYFRALEGIGADAVLISDPGVLRLCRRVAPALPVHISTQANVLNAEAVRFWKEAGACRVVLARELSMEEIAAIHTAVPDMELEAFVHGAMCISYSGRCYLSDYMDSRPANRGACVQACRRRYEIRSFEGDGEWHAVEEDGRGAYLLNSRDLNMSARLSELSAAGVCSFKIEGRMKGEYYLAAVVNAYRRILDGGYTPALGEELETVSHRTYTAGEGGISPESRQEGSCTFVAIVRRAEGEFAVAEMRGRFKKGDTLEILSPHENFLRTFTVGDIWDPEGNLTEDAKLVQGLYRIRCPHALREGEILRRRK